MFSFTPRSLMSFPAHLFGSWPGLGVGGGGLPVSHGPRCVLSAQTPQLGAPLRLLALPMPQGEEGESLGMRTAVAGKECACPPQPARPTRRAAGLCGFNWVLLPCPSVSLMISVSPEEGNRLVRPPVATNSFLWGSLGKVKE